MANNTHHDASAENSVMDYKEHERTYDLFLKGSKYLTVICVALMIAMAFGFFGGAGLIGGTIAFIVLTLIGIFAF